MASLFCGAEGDRTPGLVIANDALSQLSYCPIIVRRNESLRSFPPTPLSLARNKSDARLPNNLEPRMGVEPTTYALRMRCSTN